MLLVVVVLERMLVIQVHLPAVKVAMAWKMILLEPQSIMPVVVAAAVAWGLRHMLVAQAVVDRAELEHLALRLHQVIR